MKKTLLSLTALAALSMPLHAQAGDSIQIVGSSTVYPFVTVSAEEFGKTAGLAEFVSELIGDEAAGEYGYLSDKGLIPLSEEELTKMQARANALVESAAK